MLACPTCHRPFGAAGRICYACRLPILRHHKWHVVGCYVIHDDCQNPTMRLLVEVRPETEAIAFPAEKPLEEFHATEEDHPAGQ